VDWLTGGPADGRTWQDSSDDPNDALSALADSTLSISLQPDASPGVAESEPTAAKLARLEAENAAAMDAEDYDRADKLAEKIAAIEELEVRPAPAPAPGAAGRNVR
jgi:hypothetical protein